MLSKNLRNLKLTLSVDYKFEILEFEKNIFLFLSSLVIQVRETLLEIKFDCILVEF